MALATLLVAFAASSGLMEGQTAYFSGATTTLPANGLNSPYGVAIDGSGNIFVADTGNNQVKEILAAGGYTTVNVLGGGYSFVTPRGVAVDQSGNVFVADDSDHPGDANDSALKEILFAGGYTTVNTIGTGLTHLYGVAVDSADNVFVASYGSTAVQELMAPGYTVINTLGSGFSGPTGIALDANENVFVTDNNDVKEILASSGYSTVVTLLTMYGGPTGIAVDPSGNVFFADQYQAHVDELLAADGYRESTLRVHGGGLPSPSGVAIDARGNLFVVSQGSTSPQVIRTQAVNLGETNVVTGPAITVGLNFTFVSSVTLGTPAVLTQGNTGQDFTDLVTGDTCTAGATFSAGGSCTLNVSFTPSFSGIRYGAATLTDASGNGIATAYLYATGSGPEVSFTPAKISGRGGATDAAGVAVDGSANLFVADTANNVVNKIAPSGAFVSLGSGFSSPAGVALDGAGNVFVADTGSNSVKEILATGGYITVSSIGSGFNAPLGVAVDTFGNVYVADSGNNAVKEILASGGYTSTITIGSGFANPNGIAVDVNGNVFVADTGNNAVKEIVAASGYTTITPIGSGFFAPGGVAVDGEGNVFVGDSGNGLVKELLVAAGYASGNTLGGTFTQPRGVAVDGSGNVYVSDPSNHVVAVLDYFDPPILSFYTTPLGETSGDSPRVVTITNIGNAPLNFPAGTNPNPSITSGFTLNSSSTCPQVSPGASAAVLAPGSICTDSVSFSPVVIGVVSGRLVTKDDNLNAVAPNFDTQTIFLNGTGIAPRPTITFSVPDHFYGDPPFTVSATTNGTAPITYSVVSGPATIVGSTVTLTGVGVVTLEASEAADANFSAGVKDASFNVFAATPTIVFNVPNHLVGDAPFTVSAISNSTGAFTYAVVSGPATIAGSTVTLTGVAGTVTLLASQAANGNYAAGSQTATFTVTGSGTAPSGTTPAIVFTVPNHQFTDAPFVVSATSNSNGAFTYSVLSGPATIAGATVTLTGAGQVVLEAMEAASGSYSIGSAETTFTVEGSIGLTATPATVTVAPGSSATFTVTATPEGSTTFADAINLTAYGLPDGFSAVFAPATIAAGSAAASSKLTVQTTASASLEKKQLPTAPLTSIAFAFLLLPLFGMKSGRSLLRKMSKRPMAVVILLLSMGAVLGMTGCGTGYYNVPKKYDIVVIATDAVTGVNATTVVSLITQQ